MMGPCATQMLADYGADVIKIERPGAGDLSRSSLADDPDGLNNPVFCSLNRNKRSIALDLRGAGRQGARLRSGRRRRRGGEQLPRRRHGAHGLRLRGTARSDQPAHHLRRRHRASARAGRYAHKGGQDVLAQALTGVMARKRRPSPADLDLPDGAGRLLGRHALVQGILLALLQRERTGDGQKVTVSLYDSMLAMQMQEAAMI